MRNNKGVSLIVLLITIIVMVILAGVIVLTLNDSGIIDKANEAVESTNRAQAYQLAQVKWAEAYAVGLRGKADLEKYVLDELTKEGIDAGDYLLVVTENGIEKKNWRESVIKIVNGVPIPKGFVASGATGENTKNGGLVIYEGTEAVTDANVKEAKRSRNQYVWVPVDEATFATTFVRQNFGLNNTISATLGTDFWEIIPTTEGSLAYITEETLEEVQAMYASVKKYGGFYIARYEAGVNVGSQKTSDDGVIIEEVYSMMGKAPYNYIRWTYNNVMNGDTEGAVEVARSIYPNDQTNTTGVISTLTYGVQWDRTLAWWLETGAKDIAGNTIDVKSSTTYGNHYDSVIELAAFNAGAQYSTNGTSYNTITSNKSFALTWLLTTGATEKTKVNNIYDMAGNMYEWTMEGASPYYRVLRGGCFSFGSTSNGNPVVSRYYESPNKTFGNRSGFRPALYIK